MISADAPELVAIANLASLAPSKLAAGFNDAANLFDHLTLEELARLQGACVRLTALQGEMSAALESYREAAHQLLGISDAG